MTGAQQVPSGWYDDGSGRQRWWDGEQWTDKFADQQETRHPSKAASALTALNAKREQWQDKRETQKTEKQKNAEADREAAIEAASTVAALNRPIYEFMSHIEGKNAKVQIWSDRIEWERKAVSSRKVAAGAMTLGLTLLASGIRGKDTDLVPMKSVTSVTSKKGAGFNTVVRVNTAGGAVEFRVAHKEAEAARKVINELILTRDQPVIQVVIPAPVAEASAPATSTPDITAQLIQLGQLRDAGILTDDEFNAKKAELLSRF